MYYSISLILLHKTWELKGIKKHRSIQIGLKGVPDYESTIGKSETIQEL